MKDEVAAPTITLNKFTPFLGQTYHRDIIKKHLDNLGFKYSEFSNQQQKNEQIVNNLLDNKIIGLFDGRMEFGPRALGGRSIIANPVDAKMQKKLNLKIKFRESFRPFAPIVIEKYAKEWFKIKNKNQYMLLTYF